MKHLAQFLYALQVNRAHKDSHLLDVSFQMNVNEATCL